MSDSSWVLKTADGLSNQMPCRPREAMLARPGRFVVHCRKCMSRNPLSLIVVTMLTRKFDLAYKDRCLPDAHRSLSNGPSRFFVTGLTSIAKQLLFH
jgi:hypothetical protein